MPDRRLEGFGVRSYGGGIDDGNEYADICDRRRVASVAADNSASRGVNFPRIRKSSNEVSGDIFLRVAVDDEHIEEGLLLCSARGAFELSTSGAQS
jgi:hypothetical protein